MDREIPVSTVELFPLLDEKLIEILRSIPENDWEKQTIASKWKIKDVAAHLLDGNIRGISLLRDKYFGENPRSINSYTDLVSYLDKLNADWVYAMKRVSPALIIDFLELTGREYFRFLSSLDPFAKAIFSVAWAGEEESENWFHIAREYTEKWHHQQQIRHAVGAEEDLLSEKLYFPFLDTCLRALPYHYRYLVKPNGYVIQILISGEVDFQWLLIRKGSEWHLTKDINGPFHCVININEKLAWRIFTKGISKEKAKGHVQIEGDLDAGEKILDMLAVMA